MDELTAWKPDLEACLAELQASVGALQGEQTAKASLPASGSKVVDLSDPSSGGVIHGPDGHGKSHLPRGGLLVGGVPPTTSPANSTPNFHLPMQSRLLDTALAPNSNSHQIVAGLGATPPSILFPPIFRFVEGLRQDICVVVMVQRPKDLDTACALAILQEEVADGQRGRGGAGTIIQKEYPLPPTRLQQATPLPLPPPPAPARTPTISPAVDDRRATEATLAGSDASKLTALCNFLHTKELCFKCGERWGHDHVCPPTVKLHVIEDMLSLFSMETPLEDTGNISQPGSRIHPRKCGSSPTTQFQVQRHPTICSCTVGCKVRKC